MNSDDKGLIVAGSIIGAIVGGVPGAIIGGLTGSVIQGLVKCPNCGTLMNWEDTEKMYKCPKCSYRYRKD